MLTVRRGQLVDIHYCSQLNEAGAAETPTTPGWPTNHVRTVVSVVVTVISICYDNNILIRLIAEICENSNNTQKQYKRTS